MCVNEEFRTNCYQIIIRDILPNYGSIVCSTEMRQVLVDQSAIISSYVCHVCVHCICCKYRVLYAEYRHHNCGERAYIFGNYIKINHNY
jgi:hypothetical protein